MHKNITIGIDLGDKKHVACILIDNETGGKEEVLIRSVANNSRSIKKFMRDFPGATVAIEACVYSPSINRLLEGMGHTVYVGNPRKLRCIWDSENKTDTRDAEMLARICRYDPKLLYPIKHRSESAQLDLQMLKSRDVLVEVRTKLINHVRSVVKLMGSKLTAGISAPAFATKAREEMPEDLLIALSEVLDEIQNLSRKILKYDAAIEKMAEEKYPETRRLRQIKGVGPIIAAAFVLTIDDPGRFKKSRDIGAYLGLVPKRDQSGGTDKQLRISKAGNCYLRRLLNSGAHYILGPFGEDCDLRRYGEKIAARGGKNAKRRALTAVSRKLGVLLHRLWVSGEDYDPLYNTRGKKKSAA